ncbi:MAG: hypothetical protein JRN52_06715 [Nitrososphaerota archaeon]|nr:hypothetical protein [Nitrososphaerota archaeon]
MNGRKNELKNDDEKRLRTLRELRQDLDKREAGGVVCYFSVDLGEGF